MELKPETIRREEFVQAVYAAINEAQLPAYAIVDALRNILHEAEGAKQEQIQRDIEAYNAYLQKQMEEEEDQGEE